MTFLEVTQIVFLLALAAALLVTRANVKEIATYVAGVAAVVWAIILVVT